MIKKFYKEFLYYLNTKANSRHALPSVIVLGAQKAGTSSIYNYLVQHPEFSNSKTKEVAYFSKYFEEGIDFYKSHFLYGKKLKLDATPDYIYRDKCPERIHSVFGQDIKFIVSLRNPIDRAYSAWNMYRKLSTMPFYRSRFNSSLSSTNIIYSYYCGKDFPTFEQNIIDELNWLKERKIQEPSILRRGFYTEQILYWLDYFSIENFFFIDFDDFSSKEKLKDTLDNLQIFLGLNKTINLVEENRVANKGQYNSYKISKETLKDLDQLYSLKNKDLEKITSQKFKWLNPK